MPKIHAASLKRVVATDVAPTPVARPFLPPAEAILPYFRGIDDRRWYSNFGPLLNEFEARLSRRLAAPVVTVANGTQGLALALKALDLPRGSLIAMPSWTFVATAHAVLQAELIPWLLDVDPDSWQLTPDLLSASLPDAPGPVSGVIVVAPFGQPVDTAPWLAVQAATGLSVLVDAAAAFDSVTEAVLPTMVSLHATKVLGIGEGGLVAFPDPALAARFRSLTSYGFQGARESLMPATNAKLSEYAAAIGLAALDLWPTTRMRYARVAQALRIALSAEPEVRFQTGWGTRWVSSVCVVGLPDGSADAVERRLSSEAIDTRRWWGKGCHRHPAFAGLPQTTLQATDRLASSTIGLPYAVDMDAAAIQRLAEALIEAVRRG